MKTEERTPIAESLLDSVLSAQIIVGWAGESGEEKRMGWWRTDFCSEFGGEDLLQQLLPHTWQWATLQSVREAGMRADSQLRTEAHDADVVLSLYNLGFTVNERLDERFQALKKSGQPPTEALPALKDVISAEWNQDNFQNWVKGHGEVTFEKLPTGRRTIEAAGFTSRSGNWSKRFGLAIRINLARIFQQSKLCCRVPVRIQNCRTFKPGPKAWFATSCIARRRNQEAARIALLSLKHCGVLLTTPR